ncbi:MAG: antitoxin family protein [Acidobacteriia bacterium]|nr:antitoxin family protein [Terriglobia bacterium]
MTIAAKYENGVFRPLDDLNRRVHSQPGVNEYDHFL